MKDFPIEAIISFNDKSFRLLFFANLILSLKIDISSSEKT
jgi:hypothetical protein